MSKIVGILGGMGPLSTIELMRKVVEKTPVKKEQDHIRMLVDNRPEIPDRTDFILGKGPSPVPMLQESAQQLEKWGAELLAISCNSVHAFIEEIREVINIPVLDMIDLVRQELEKRFPPKTDIALLTTTGALHSRLYYNYLEQFSIITPNPEIQEKLVMEAIYGEDGIKTLGNTAQNQRKLLAAIELLTKQESKAIIAGCTEVELALSGVELQIPIIFPLEILANEIVKIAKG